MVGKCSSIVLKIPRLLVGFRGKGVDWFRLKILHRNES